MPEYISVAEFAKEADVTVQAIYQRLAKDLKPYCKVVEGHKTIDRQALSLFVKEKETQPLVEDLNNKDDSLTRYLKEENERLNRIIAEKDEQLREYAERFASIAEREQENSAKALQTAGQAQVLHAKELGERKKTWLEKLFNK